MKLLEISDDCKNVIVIGTCNNCNISDSDSNSNCNNSNSNSNSNCKT